MIIANPEDALGLLAATWPDHRDQAHGGGSGTAADPASRSPPHPRAEPGRQRVHAHPAVHEPHPTAENVSTIQFGVMEHQEHRAPQQGRRRRSGTRTMKSPQLMAKSTGAYLKKSDYFWRRLASHFRRPEFVRCLYDHLNSIDVSAVDWKAERKANLTSSYYGLAAMYSPIEALFFEELVQNIRRGKLPMHMTPYPEHKPVAWWRPATFRKYFLYMWMQDWASQHGHNQRMKPSSKKFYNTVLEGLDLPVKPVKRDGYDCFEFTPKTVHEHIVDGIGDPEHGFPHGLPGPLSGYPVSAATGPLGAMVCVVQRALCFLPGIPWYRSDHIIVSPPTSFGLELPPSADGAGRDIDSTA